MFRKTNSSECSDDGGDGSLGKTIIDSGRSATAAAAAGVVVLSLAMVNHKTSRRHALLFHIIFSAPADLQGNQRLYSGLPAHRSQTVSTEVCGDDFNSKAATGLRPHIHAAGSPKPQARKHARMPGMHPLSNRLSCSHPPKSGHSSKSCSDAANA